jgi:TonB family protein
MSSSTLPTYIFTSLPEWRAPWKEFACSVAGQLGAIVGLSFLLVLQPVRTMVAEHAYRLTPLVSTPAPINRQPQRIPAEVRMTKPSTVEVAAKPLLVAPPARLTPKIETEQAPKIAIQTPHPHIEITKPAIPRPPVQTNVFSTGSSATPTTAQVPQKVQTGGFGDPNGVPAQASNGRPATIAAAGSFDLPSGGGVGNGLGGTNGVRGVVASAGFGNGIATGTGQGSTQAAVRESGFGDAAATPSRAAKVPNSAATHVLPAEIVSKPTPTYTDEARQLKVEGEVLLEVVLEASGQVKVNRLVRGLGHGLDENAVKAAQAIHFKPALRDGQPSDSTVILHIIFQLA